MGAQIKNDVWMSNCSQYFALLLKLSDRRNPLSLVSDGLRAFWIVEGLVYEFRGAGEVVAFRSTDLPVGADAKCLVFEKLNTFEDNFVVALATTPLLVPIHGRASSGRPSRKAGWCDADSAFSHLWSEVLHVHGTFLWSARWISALIWT